MNVRSTFLHVLRWLAAGALVCVSLTAGAVEWRKGTDMLYTPGNGNFTAIPGAGSDSMWSQGTKTPVSGGARWTGPTKQLPFNPSPTANFKATFSAAAMGRAIFSPAVAIPLLASPLISYLIDQACVRLAGGSMQLSSSSLWEECVMTTQTVTEYRAGSSTYNATGAWSPSKDAAIQSYIGQLPVTGMWSDCHYNITWSVVLVEITPGSMTGQVRGTNPNCTNSAGYSNGATTQNIYPTYGTRQTQQTTQTGWQASTEAAAQAKAQTKLDAWSQCDFLYGYGSCSAFDSKSSGGLLDEVMNSGSSVDATLEAPTVQTPLMEAPQTTTTNDPASGKTVASTTQTQDDYSCLVIQNGAAVQCSQAKKTTTLTSTTTNPNGTGTVTTSTSTTTSLTGDPAKTDCDIHPDSVGCAKFGNATGTESLTKDTKNVWITSATFSGGGCPGPISFSAFGRSYAFAYDPLCARLASLSMLFMALSALVSAWILADGFKVS